ALLILAALEIELQSLRPRPRTQSGHQPCLTFQAPDQPDSIPIVVTGPGCRRAADVTATALDAMRPSAVLVIGFAGACGDMTPGQVIVPQQVIDDETGRVFHPTRAGAGAGTLVTVTRPLLAPRHKRRCRQEHGADAVDMETAAVAAECDRRSVPWSCLRAISDRVDQAIPPWAPRLCDACGRSRPAAAAADLLTHPWHIGPLLRLRRSAHLAADALARAIPDHI
ncbi:MAG: hypothetical protein OER86_11235, partial [Phycisphaerae bacterium]|nr:hypothetical protein [Phycisphaerae bacterium]